MRDEGFRENLVEASGLARRRDRGGLYDFFRDRLMFPIRDVAGNVVAFGGRDLSGDAPGKYINTPDPPLFDQGRLVGIVFSDSSSRGFFTNIDSAACAVALPDCTNATLVAAAQPPAIFLWADEFRPAPEFHRSLGAQAIQRAQNNPF